MEKQKAPLVWQKLQFRTLSLGHQAWQHCRKTRWSLQVWSDDSLSHRLLHASFCYWRSRAVSWNWNFLFYGCSRYIVGSYTSGMSSYFHYPFLRLSTIVEQQQPEWLYCLSWALVTSAIYSKTMKIWIHDSESNLNSSEALQGHHPSLSWNLWSSFCPSMTEWRGRLR